MCIGKAFADCICMCYLCVQERYHTFFFTPANGWCTFLCNSALSVRVLRLKRDYFRFGSPTVHPNGQTFSCVFKCSYCVVTKTELPLCKRILPNQSFSQPHVLLSGDNYTMQQIMEGIF